MSEIARVELRSVDKRFGGVHAVEDVSLALRAGEVLAIVGHNGAGKSTLMKLVSGALSVDAGKILVEGQERRLRGTADARRCGIETLYQDLALTENLDAVANLFLGRERTNRLGILDERAMEAAARRVVARVNPGFERFRRPVRELSGGERQSIAFARALQFEARVLILDEPTAALGPHETRAVGSLIERLKRAGIGIFLVSHDLNDVFALADRIAVMRRGRLVGILTTASAGRDEVLSLMLGGTETGWGPESPG